MAVILTWQVAPTVGIETQGSGSNIPLSFNFYISHTGGETPTGNVYFNLSRPANPADSIVVASLPDFNSNSGPHNRSALYGTTSTYPTLTLQIKNDYYDETGNQGEIIRLSIHSAQPYTTANTIGYTDFTLFDLDFDEVVSPTSQTISSSASSVSFTLSQSGTSFFSTMSYRVISSVNGSTTTGGTQYWVVNSSSYQNTVFNLTGSQLPVAGTSGTYRVQMYNGNAWTNVGSQFFVTRQGVSLSQPISNGATVSDETPSGSVTVSFNLSSTGSGGVLQVMQRPTSYNPSINDVNWGSAQSVADNSAASFYFTQARGTVMYYYSRRYDSSTPSQAVGRTVNQSAGAVGAVAERIPTTPSIASITDNTTSHTVVLGNNPAADGFTSVYYYQSTNPNAMNSTSAWRDQGTDNPPTGWTTSSTFTSPTASTTYYYWALGWAESGGPDMATLTGPASRTTAATTTPSTGYGLEVYNSSNAVRMSVTDRDGLIYPNPNPLATDGLWSKNFTGTSTTVAIPGAVADSVALGNKFFALDMGSTSTTLGSNETYTFSTDLVTLTGFTAANKTIKFMVIRV